MHLGEPFALLRIWKQEQKSPGRWGRTYKLADRGIEPLSQLAILCLLEFEQQ
jgi:hypothetical protein